MDISIEFISIDIFKQMNREEKISYILEHVKKDKIIVLDNAMTFQEESKLIEETMKTVSKKFPGIEVSTLHESTLTSWKEKIIRALGGSTGGLTVIGPSKLVKKISQNPNRISLLAGGESKK